MSTAKDREKKQVKFGSKQRAGTILSSILRSIMNEKTEVGVIDEYGPEGECTSKPKIITVAEALSRDLVNKALTCVDPKIKLDYIKVLFDRVEGKVCDMSDADKGATSIPDRISELNKGVANKLAKKAMGT